MKEEIKPKIEKKAAPTKRQKVDVEEKKMEAS